MISSDLAARLRAMTEDAVQPLAPVRAVPADLPEFRAGNRFAATIRSILPDGTFKAEVAGKTVTLAMAQSAKVGDTLELLVLDRTPRAIVAGRADAPPQPGVSPPAPSTTLSRGAQLIGTLLAQAGEASQEAAALTRNQPIMPAPPHSGRALAPLLQSAIAESGVFYEAHQALWITGRWPLRALLREPQGQHSSAQAQPGNAGQRPANAMDMDMGMGMGMGGQTPASASALLVRTALGELALQAPAAEMPQRIATANLAGPNLPADLGPVMRQQLDALSNDHVLWQGQVWPGQNMEWEIEDATRERAADESQDPPTWTSTLRLNLPRLGTVAATLKLNGTGVTMALSAAERASADALRNAITDLAGALETAGVPLQAMVVEHGEAV